RLPPARGAGASVGAPPPVRGASVEARFGGVNPYLRTLVGHELKEPVRGQGDGGRPVVMAVGVVVHAVHAGRCLADADVGQLLKQGWVIVGKVEGVLLEQEV